MSQNARWAKTNSIIPKIGMPYILFVRHCQFDRTQMLLTGFTILGYSISHKSRYNHIAYPPKQLHGPYLMPFPYPYNTSIISDSFLRRSNFCHWLIVFNQFSCRKTNRHLNWICLFFNYMCDRMYCDGFPLQKRFLLRVANFCPSTSFLFHPFCLLI